MPNSLLLNSCGIFKTFFSKRMNNCTAKVYFFKCHFKLLIIIDRGCDVRSHNAAIDPVLAWGRKENHCLLTGEI